MIRVVVHPDTVAGKKFGTGVSIGPNWDGSQTNSHMRSANMCQTSDATILKKNASPVTRTGKFLFDAR